MSFQNIFPQTAHHSKELSTLKVKFPNCYNHPQLLQSFVAISIHMLLNFWWSIQQKMTNVGYSGATNDQTIRLIFFLRKLAFIGCWGQFLMHKKSLLRTSESSRFLNSIIWGLYFDVLKKKSFDRILKTHVEFYHLFCRRPLRLCEVKTNSYDGSSINFHYSRSHRASVFGTFAKTSGQARSLLCVKT